jgi:DNA-directed RNA polymerase specialized sigma24 family protein
LREFSSPSPHSEKTIGNFVTNQDQRGYFIEMEDSELLRRYAIDHDEGAFAELVHSYIDMVHSVASRQLGSQVCLADDVTQSVFVLLARKAHSLQNHPTLAGWIYRVTQHLAAKAQPKREVRSSIRVLPAPSVETSDPLVKRLRMALSAHLAKSGNIWPDPEVTDSVSAFSEPESAFAVLRDAITNPEKLIVEKLGVDSSEDLVRERAIHAMVSLASKVPEVTPFLWETFRTDNFMSKVNAFSALEQIGFKPENTIELVHSLPLFMNSPAMQMSVPRAIASLISENTEATASSIVALQNMLVGADEGLQISTASALVSHNFTDGRVSEVLSNGLASNKRILNRVAVEALGRANGQSPAFATKLLDLAQDAQEDNVYNIVMQHAVQTTWWTRDEAISFAKELAAKDPRIQEVFINMAIQGDPTLREYFAGSNK